MAQNRDMWHFFFLMFGICETYHFVKEGPAPSIYFMYVAS
jgi:hypothetical protein